MEVPQAAEEQVNVVPPNPESFASVADKWGAVLAHRENIPHSCKWAVASFVDCAPARFAPLVSTLLERDYGGKTQSQPATWKGISLTTEDSSGTWQLFDLTRGTKVDMIVFLIDHSHPAPGSVDKVQWAIRGVARQTKVKVRFVHVFELIESKPGRAPDLNASGNTGGATALPAAPGLSGGGDPKGTGAPQFALPPGPTQPPVAPPPTPMASDDDASLPETVELQEVSGGGGHALNGDEKLEECGARPQDSPKGTMWTTPTPLPVELMQRLDNGKCGGVPFFYNKRTRRYICGATTYANLRAWALSEPCEPILPPPNLNADNERQQNKVQKFLSTVKAKAQEKLSQRGGGGEEESE